MQKEILIAKCDCCKCCGDCLNSNKEKVVNDSEIEEEKILFDLNQSCDLNNFNFNDLEKFLIQVLLERFYKCQRTIYENICEKMKKTNINNSFDFTTQENFEEQKKILEENLFENIVELSKENFEKIDNEYTKLLATFFLSDENYNEYITSQVEEMKKNFSELKNTDSINEFINCGKKNENFIDALKRHIDTGNKNGGFNNDLERHKEEIKTISEVLNQCKPYNKETFRGTGIYKNNKRIKNTETKVQGNVRDFLNKIKIAYGKKVA